MFLQVFLRNQHFNPHSRTGSDKNRQEVFVSIWISIHTPARGVTCTQLQTCLRYPISIHTPARGVTVVSCARQARAIISIHTPARGVTKTICANFINNLDFNPHSRTGSDVCLASPGTLLTHFNPHSRTGSDPESTTDIEFLDISIHTPARGVTGGDTIRRLFIPFQSTLPHGE